MTVEINEYVRQLRTVGAELPIPLAQRIITTGELALAPLVALAIDTELVVGAIPLCYGPLHALRILGEIAHPAMIAPLIHAPIPASPDRISEQRATIWDGEVPQMIARCGTDALEPLLGLLDDDHTSNIGHHRAAIALAYLSVTHTELASLIVAALNARLTTSNPDRNASAALALANMGVDASYSLVMAAYKAGHIAKDAVQPGPLRQLLLSRSNARLSCVKHPLGERYAHHPLNPPVQAETR
jgi:hypothetical protein